MDVYWLAAVLTVLVMGGTVINLSIRFIRKNFNNPWFGIGVGIVQVLSAIVFVIAIPPTDTPHWVSPFFVISSAFMGGFSIATGMWRPLVENYSEMFKASKRGERLKRGPDRWR